MQAAKTYFSHNLEAMAPRIGIARPYVFGTKPITDTQQDPAATAPLDRQIQCRPARRRPLRPRFQKLQCFQARPQFQSRAGPKSSYPNAITLVSTLSADATACWLILIPVTLTAILAIVIAILIAILLTLTFVLHLSQRHILVTLVMYRGTQAVDTFRIQHLSRVGKIPD